MLVFTDMMGRNVLLENPPKRIISLVPSQTELLYDLGLEEEVVGITKFCLHPEKWFRSKERVGGTKKIDPGKIAALAPDLIIANKEENVKEQVEALQSIAPVWISDIKNLDDALGMIEAVGKLCDKEQNGKEIAAIIKQGFAFLLPDSIVRKKVAYGIWKDPWMWAGGDTFIADIIVRMGWSNVLQEVPRYPEIGLESLVSYGPDLVLLSSEPYPFKEKHLEEVKKALPNAQVCLVDGEMFSWYGSRLVEAVPYLKSLILKIHE